MEPGQLLLTTAHLGELVEPVFVYVHFYGIRLNLIQLCGCISKYSHNHMIVYQEVCSPLHSNKIL